MNKFKRQGARKPWDNIHNNHLQGLDKIREIRNFVLKCLPGLAVISVRGW